MGFLPPSCFSYWVFIATGGLYKANAVRCMTLACFKPASNLSIMKVLILFALVAASQAAVVLHHGLIGTGASQQFRSQDGLGNYAFGYNEGHATGGSFRRESGGHGVVAGSYGLTVADGRQRVVNYVADGAGFRANVQTNEPGVEPKDPAATSINKAGILYAAPAVVHAAPAAVHYAGAIPFAHHGLAAPHYAYNALW